jgi:hypothetical protein
MERVFPRTGRLPVTVVIYAPVPHPLFPCNFFIPLVGLFFKFLYAGSLHFGDKKEDPYSKIGMRVFFDSFSLNSTE